MAYIIHPTSEREYARTGLQYIIDPASGPAPTPYCPACGAESEYYQNDVVLCDECARIKGETEDYYDESLDVEHFPPI